MYLQVVNIYGGLRWLFHRIPNSAASSVSVKAREPIELKRKPRRSLDAMEEMTHKDPFAVVTAAVMYSPKGKPVFREIAYSCNPYLNTKFQKVHVWRFYNPHSFVELSDEDRDKEQEARKANHGLKYVPSKEEREKWPEQYEVCEVVKKTWKEHCQKSEKRPVVFYTQEEVGELLKLLEIPCLDIKTKFKGMVFNPYRKHSVETAPGFTCGLPHNFGRPCQATMAMRWCLFVYQALEEAPRKLKKGSWADRVRGEVEHEEKEAPRTKTGSCANRVEEATHGKDDGVAKDSSADRVGKEEAEHEEDDWADQVEKEDEMKSTMNELD